jgi:uncharacterized protein (DUF1778 family)
MARKSEQLQIRVTPEQKRTLKHLSRAAGADLSSYVLSRALPAHAERFAQLVALLAEGEDHRYVLAELSDLLSGLAAGELTQAVGSADLSGLSPFLQNYVSAMVEQTCASRGVRPPEWTRGIPPLETPWFATPMKRLRAHLLRSSPVPYKRRNLFVDAGVGDRV